MTMTRILTAVLLADTVFCAHAEETGLKEAPIAQQEIIFAALDGNIDIIDKTLAQGYPPDARDPENRTVLM